jgi:peptidyl-prolyl cis-trans isomerase SurA
MKLLKTKPLKFTIKQYRFSSVMLLFLCSVTLMAQDSLAIQDSQVEPPKSMDLVAPSEVKQAFKRIKLDGIAAVVGDYVILESDIEKTLIDLKSQGVSDQDVNRCQLLGKLMEDRLFAHQAVQDSVLISDDEIAAIGERQLQQLVSQAGSLDRVLKVYKKEDEESFRQELNKINKLRMLSERMQTKVVEEIEITPEEVRQFFNDIPKEERPVFGAELEISQIVKTPQAPEEEKQKVIDKLNELKADVEDNNASFSVKAILYSQDPGSKSKGGFYPMSRETPFVKEFKDVAFSLQEGEISDPFESPFGYHIIYIEKIRGQELDLRHILMVPEVPSSAVKAAIDELKDIKKKIEEGAFTFAEAALNFSDEKETKFDGGVLRNPTNYDSRFELTKMDPSLYKQVSNLKDNEISFPIEEPDPRGGQTKYKILKISNRYGEHTADFARDYMKIQELAKTEKQLKAINDWRGTHIEDTYISVSKSNRDCDFANNWVKE